MPWTALFFLVGAMAISGLPPLNGFASEWLTFQAFLFGFSRLRRAARPVSVSRGGRAAGAHDRAGGGVFREGVRHHVPGAAAERRGGRRARVAGGDAGAAGVPGALCLVLGLFPGVVLGVLGGVTRSLPGLRLPAGMLARRASRSRPDRPDRLRPRRALSLLGAALARRAVAAAVW